MSATLLTEHASSTSKPPLESARAAPDAPTLEALEEEITTLAAHIGAAEYRLLRAVGEFEARCGHVGIGIKSCAHWLNWKCGMSLGAAREHVRVAKALRQLPRVSETMARGQLSYSKVRAITRIATTETEEALVELSSQTTASQLEEIARQYRRMKGADDAGRAADRQQRRAVSWRYDDEGMLQLRATLPPEQGAVVVQALSAAADALWRAARGESSTPDAESLNKNSSAGTSVASAPSTPTGHAADDGRAARYADALVLMSETLLKHGPAELSAPERHEVVVHVDLDALREDATEGAACIENAAPLSFETVRRLTCDASIVPMLHDEDGDPLRVGRRTRVIGPALRRALRTRDHTCRFPGCDNRHADAHHIDHWANGGSTDLENLVLLCRLHHRLLHEEGFGVRREPGRGFVFTLPDGKPLTATNAWRIPAHDPVLALMEANAPLAIDANTIIPHWYGDNPDYGWIVGGLLQRDRGAPATAEA